MLLLSFDNHMITRIDLQPAVAINFIIHLAWSYILHGFSLYISCGTNVAEEKG